MTTVVKYSTVCELKYSLEVTFTVSHTGLVVGSDITQTSILWKNKDESATMSCNHTKDFSYNQMYWYKQLPGEAMKLIVFTTLGKENHDFGNFSKERFSATKPDAASGTFTVKNLAPEDKGLYFCAVSEHSDTDALDS